MDAIKEASAQIHELKDLFGKRQLTVEQYETLQALIYARLEKALA